MGGAHQGGPEKGDDLPVMALWARRSLTDDEITRFDLVARSTAQWARLVVVPFLAPGAGGMTVGRWILLRRGQEHRAALVAHELVHVEQFRNLRTRAFLVRYLRSYFMSRRGGVLHRAAYLAIPAEQEARDRTQAWL
jgi:hypothetical protein